MGLALIGGCSKGEQAQAVASAAPAQPAAATAQAAPQGDNGKGEHVYKGTCAMCHGTGAGGAPMFKSKEEWGPRIAQGLDTLHTHALQGFSGAKGTMPAKGGNVSLSDDDVKSAVDYMASMAK
jgi:cytochrome c5